MAGGAGRTADAADLRRGVGFAVGYKNLMFSEGDVGKALNPLQLIGQIEGGIAQGVGLAVLEEIVVEDGLVENPSFTDYLIPTMLDMPDVAIALIEQPAIRAATGLALERVPVRPQDIALAREA